MTATAIGSYATSALLKLRTGIGDTTDDTELGKVCDQVNSYIETKTGRVLAPIASATFTLDGDGSRRLWYRRGLRSVTLLELAEYTGADYSTVAVGQYFLRPSDADLRPGWPYTRIEFTDRPTGTFGRFPRGLDTVRITATTGWSAIPDDIIDVALTAATRAWHGVQSGQADIVGTDEMGRPMVSRFFSARDLETLRTYAVDIP
jgi:hypothetical protein